ncbi:MAG: hypothetical protein HY717_06015 [Planctomycetes bacterium]|nr:hypothetical protein [Planctomycetota bacterium]
MLLRIPFRFHIPFLAALGFTAAGLLSCCDHPVQGPAQTPAPSSPPQPAAAATNTSGPSKPASPVLKELEARLRVPAASPSGTSPATPGQSQAGPAPPAAAEEAPSPLSDLEREKFLAEIDQTVQAWVKALDGEKTEEVARIAVTGEDLKALVSEAHERILSRALLSKNQHLLEKLQEAARGQEIQLVKWAPGSLTRSKIPYFKSPVPHLAAGTVELSLGATSLILEIRKLVKTGGGWKALELAVKG